MDSYNELFRVTNEYESIPKNYSTDEAVYMIEMHTLDAIGKQQGITVSDLARKMNRTKGAVSQKIDKLEKKGFITKEVSKDHFREKNLFLTDKGKQVFDFHKQLDEHFFQLFLGALSEYSEADFQKMIKLNTIFIQMVKELKIT